MNEWIRLKCDKLKRFTLPVLDKIVWNLLYNLYSAISAEYLMLMLSFPLILLIHSNRRQLHQSVLLACSSLISFTASAGCALLKGLCWQRRGHGYSYKLTLSYTFASLVTHSQFRAAEAAQRLKKTWSDSLSLHLVGAERMGVSQWNHCIQMRK